MRKENARSAILVKFKIVLSVPLASDCLEILVVNQRGGWLLFLLLGGLGGGREGSIKHSLGRVEEGPVGIRVLKVRNKHLILFLLHSATVDNNNHIKVHTLRMGAGGKTRPALFSAGASELSFSLASRINWASSVYPRVWAKEYARASTTRGKLVS